MKKTTVLIVFWDLGIGGIQSVIRDFVIHLGNTRPTVSVYILIKNRTDSHVISEIFKNKHAHIYSPKNLFNNIKILRQLYFFIWLAYHYINLRPDICLTFLDTLSIYMILLRKLVFWKKTRVVINENILTSTHNRITKRAWVMWNFFTIVFYPYADLILVPSMACKHDLISNFHISGSTIHVSRNWIIQKKTHARFKKYDLVYIGRFDIEKNPLNLIELCEKLRRQFPDVLLSLVGKGALESSMKSLVKKYNLTKNVVFLGYRFDTRQILAESKIFISTTQNEGLPISMLEAGMQELPCVSTSFQGSDEIIIHGKTGYIAHTTSESCAYIRSLLTDTALRRKIGKQARMHVTTLFGIKNLEVFTQHILKK